MSMDEPGASPQASAAEQASSILWIKARALKDNGLAEIDYELRIEDVHGNRVQESGTIRRDPFTTDYPYGTGGNDG